MVIDNRREKCFDDDSMKVLISLLLIVAIASFLVQVVQATTMSFTVYDNKEVTKSISLAVEDHVFIKFTVLGSPNNTIRFYITYPNGTVKDFDERADFQYIFVCSLEGNYILHFSNADSLEEKFVTLDYEIQHYIFGIPQMLFLTIIIVVICVVAVATFIMMGKSR